MRGHGAGFTIIELTLFLAISGLLLSIMFIGTGSLAARQRFSDTTDSLQVYFQSQYDEVLNGVSVRSTSDQCSGGPSSAAGMSSKCLMLGKLLTLNGTTVTSQYVISTNQLDGTETSDAARFVKATPMVITAADTSTYELKWGAKSFNITRSGSPRQSVNNIAFLRVPDSGRIVQLYYSASTPGNPTDSLRNAVQNDSGAYNPSGSIPTNPSLSVCIQNDNDFAVARPRSAIFFDQGGGTGSILTNYSPGATLCP